MLVTILRPPSIIEHPQSINTSCGCSERYTAVNCIVLLPNRVLRSQSLQSDHKFNITNIHAMSYTSDFLTCSSRVNIWEPAVCFAVSLPLAVFRVGIPNLSIPTAMSDSKSLDTSLLEVMICSKNERVFIHDLSDLAFQIIFDAWWASMNVGSKGQICLE